MAHSQVSERRSRTGGVAVAPVRVRARSTGAASSGGAARGSARLPNRPGPFGPPPRRGARSRDLGRDEGRAPAGGRLAPRAAPRPWTRRGWWTASRERRIVAPSGRSIPSPAEIRPRSDRARPPGAMTALPAHRAGAVGRRAVGPRDPARQAILDVAAKSVVRRELRRLRPPRRSPGARPVLRAAAARRRAARAAHARPPAARGRAPRAISRTPWSGASDSAVSSRSTNDRGRPEGSGADGARCVGGLPPAFRAHRDPTAWDAPPSRAASSLVRPAAIAALEPPPVLPPRHAGPPRRPQRSPQPPLGTPSPRRRRTLHHRSVATTGRDRPPHVSGVRGPRAEEAGVGPSTGPTGRRPRRRDARERPRRARMRAPAAAEARDQGLRPHRRPRLRRGLAQPEPPPLGARLPLPHRARDDHRRRARHRKPITRPAQRGDSDSSATATRWPRRRRSSEAGSGRQYSLGLPSTSVPSPRTSPSESHATSSPSTATS